MCRGGVLINGHSLLVRRNIAMPGRSCRGGCAEGNEGTLCLTITNGIVTVFVIDCRTSPALGGLLGGLRHDKVAIVLQDYSPCVGRRDLGGVFSIPRNFVEIVATSGNHDFRGCDNTITRGDPTCTIRGNSTRTFVTSILNTSGLINARGAVSTLDTFNSTVKFNITTLLNFVNKVDRLATIGIVVFRTI